MKNPNRIVLALLASLLAFGCSHHRSQENYASIGGHWAGKLRAADIVGFHDVAMDLTQYNKAVTGTMSYDARKITVTGEVGYADANLTLAEAGCPDTVPMWVKVGPEGLTVGFHKDNGCGYLSGSGLLTR